MSEGINFSDELGRSVAFLSSALYKNCLHCFVSESRNAYGKGIR